MEEGCNKLEAQSISEHLFMLQHEPEKNVFLLVQVSKTLYNYNHS